MTDTPNCESGYPNGIGCKKCHPPIEKEELRVWNTYIEDYFLDVLNGDTSLEEARENIKSFRNTKQYTGTNPIFKKIKKDEWTI